MSTDSSPSPDGVDKSKKNKSRKPDIQLYVPRAKRIENQVKQKNPNSEKYTATTIDDAVNNINKDNNMFLNIMDDDNSMMTMMMMMNNNDSSSTSTGGGVNNWKPNPSWFKDNSSPYSPKGVDDARYETDRANFSPQDDRTGNNWRDGGLKYGRSDEEDFSSVVPTMMFQRQQTSSSSSSDKFRKPLSQPDPRKLPHQQIEAMLKMLNIKNDSSEDDKKSTTPNETTPSTDGCYVAPTQNLNEKISRSNVPCSLKLPADDSNGTAVYDDRLLSSSSATAISPSVFWLTADVVDQLTDDGPNEVFHSSDVQSNTEFPPPPLLNKNEADSILDSLPTSYDEFEIKDLTTKKNRSNQDLVVVGCGVASSSTQCSSTSPLSSVPRTPVSVVSCGGGIVVESSSVERTSSSSPSMIDPDDLEVQLINESFEEQMKQAQVLSNAKTKEAFYRQPNLETTSSSSIVSAGSKTKSKSKQIIQKDFNSTSSMMQQANIIQTTAATTSRCEGQIGVKQGLTWAGWGAGASSGGDNSLLTTPSAAGVSSCSAGSTTAALTKKSSSGSMGSSSSSLEAPTASGVVKLDYYEEVGGMTDDDMDELSKAMIDKLLSCDDDDDNHFKYGANKTVVRSSASADVQRSTVATTSKSSFGDVECLQPSSYSSVVPISSTWSTSTTAPTSNTASVADSWEDILDSTSVPDFNFAVEQPSLDDDNLPKIDYLQFKSRDVSFDDKEFGHVLEAYDFPASTKSETLHLAMQQLDCKNFNIQWVDETHALIICNDKFAANVVLDGSHPVIKIRPLSEASVQSKRKAKEFPEVLRSYKPKPERNAFVARRLVESHLGKKSSTSTDQRLEERKKLERAKEQKKFIAQMREDVWEGRV